MGDLTQITMPRRMLELREQVLARSTKRMPKWKFRLADDIVLMLQPKVAKDFYVWNGHYNGTYENRHHMSLRFAGEVLMQNGADAKALTASKSERREAGPYTLVRFEVGVDHDDDQTYLSWTGWSGKLGPEWDPAGGFGDSINRQHHRKREFDRLEQMLRSILVTAIEDGTFDVVDANLMLSAHCLICGKGLTDPASMARYIGPECAGTSSVHVPRMHHVSAGATELKVESAWDAIPRLKKEETVDEMMDDLRARNKDEPDEVDDDIPPIELDPVRVRAGEECAGAFVDTASTMLSKHDHDIAMRGMSLAAAQCLMNEQEVEDFIKRLRHTFFLKQMMEDMEDEDELEDA